MRRLFPAGLAFRLLFLAPVVAVFLTSIGWYFASRSASVQINAEFSRRVERIQDVIETRMDTFLLALIQARALFLASEDVTPHEFQTFAETLNLPERYPGIQGIGVVQRLAEKHLKAHIERRRKDRPDYHVWPETPRAEYYPIIYLEPRDWRNQRAIGYDMFTEPTRRAAMEKARDTGDAATSAVVTLVQETNVKPQPGFLMYVPLYEKKTINSTPEERQRHLTAFIYAPFRAGDLFKAMLDQAHSDVDTLNLKATSDGALLYEMTDASMPSQNWTPKFSKAFSIDVGQRKWTIEVTSSPEFEASFASLRLAPWVILIAGFALSLLLYWLMFAYRHHTNVEKDLRLQEQSARQTAESAQLAREELLAIVSHDLQNPLTAIELNVSLMKRVVKETTDPQQSRIIKQIGNISNASGRMRRLIRDLLDSSRIEGGKVTMECAAHSPQEIIAQTLQDFAVQAKEKSIRLVSDVAGELPFVFCDRDRVMQALANLIGNAVKFSPSNSTITVSAISDINKVRFQVKDEGPGIPTEYLGKVFDRYWRPDSTTKPGTGLGLFIAKGMIEAQQGQIWVESKLGQGASFFFTLPIISAGVSVETHDSPEARAIT